MSEIALVTLKPDRIFENEQAVYDFKLELLSP